MTCLNPVDNGKHTMPCVPSYIEVLVCVLVGLGHATYYKSKHIKVTCVSLCLPHVVLITMYIPLRFELCGCVWPNAAET